MIKDKSLLTSYLSLFTSFGTVLCCALPSLLVSIGMGATFAGLVGFFPKIIWLSENKILVFSISGVLVLISFIFLYINRYAPCPISPHQAKACAVSRKWSIRVIALSVILWICGFFFAFLAPLIFI